MPVFNEQECIVDVVKSWQGALSSLDINFQIFALNDGSTDKTAEVLRAFNGDSMVKVINKPNSGHGPTILAGYHKAAGTADWLFQCDSDDEMPSEYFASLWTKRQEFDALFGYRFGRVQNIGRRIISVCSRLVVKLLFGRGVVDVNTPYRLIRSNLLQPIVRQIPADTFAPNVIISGTLARAGVRIYNHPVPHLQRRTGSVSIVKWKLWKSAFRSFWQTLWCRPVLEIGEGESVTQAASGGAA